VQSITAVTDKSTQGRAGQLVAGTMAFARLSFRQAVPFRAWFAESDGLLHEMHIDVTNAVRQMLSARRIAVEKAELVFSLDKVVADRELPIPRFTFKPGTDDEHVDAIVPVARVDRPAIGFNGTDMNGRSLSSKDLRGRVVLLDFWASWCGPCLVAMPQVQRLADKFADKPVAIVGINNDESNNVEKAKLVVQRREITFRQYMDTDSVVSRAYQIPGLPFSVLIDRKGVVRYTHFGLMPRFESEMTHQIEQLLAAGD
ncbi:MAG: TlpA disulfide reductase family protein, partial [Pirellulaceae bacterium]|nr:TlpA disulfide reductase family protein [Pirellulaceae bacterium]